MIDAREGFFTLQPTDFANENEFQELLANHPGLLKLAAGSDGDLLLVAREAGIADADDASDRWSLDHLFLNREGVPIFVEVKRASDPRARREVVAQMLDYASHGTAYWSSQKIEAMFYKTGGDNAQSILGEFLGNRDREQFWKQVEANLGAGRIRMLFVADKIGRELRRIVEFLNEQMRPAEVLALEIVQFSNANGVKTLVPSLYGDTEKAKSAKIVSSAPELAPVNIQEWFDVFAAKHDRAESPCCFQSNARTARKLHYTVLIMSNGGFYVLVSYDDARDTQAIDTKIRNVVCNILEN